MEQYTFNQKNVTDCLLAHLGSDDGFKSFLSSKNPWTNASTSSTLELINQWWESDSPKHWEDVLVLLRSFGQAGNKCRIAVKSGYYDKLEGQIAAHTISTLKKEITTCWKDLAVHVGFELHEIRVLEHDHRRMEDLTREFLIECASKGISYKELNSFAEQAGIIPLIECIWKCANQPPPERKRAVVIQPTIPPPEEQMEIFEAAMQDQMQALYLPLSDKTIVNLPGHISDWQMLARRVGFGSQSISDIEIDCRSQAEQRSKFIREYRQQNGVKANFKRLYDAYMDMGLQGPAEKMLTLANQQIMQFNERQWVKAAASIRNVNIEDIVCEAYSKHIITNCERDEILATPTNGRRADMFHAAVQRYIRLQDKSTAGMMTLLSLFLKPYLLIFLDGLFKFSSY